MNKKMLDLVMRSFDADLTAEERSALESALAASEELRQEREHLVRLRQAVSSVRADSFGPFFAARVMERIRAPRITANGADAFLAALARAFRPVAIAGAAVVIGLVINNLVKTEDMSLPGALGISSGVAQEILEPPVEDILEALS